jgi:hypothetical protein
MNIHDIPMGELLRMADVRHREHIHAGHAHLGRRALSRRQFARTAAGAAVVGATLGSGLWRPGVATAGGAFQPIPIPGGTPVIFKRFGEHFHFFGPGGIDPADAEPATITDFNGFVGHSFISGMVTRTNTVTGQVLPLPFLHADMRFMKGVFQGTDGQIHKGAFALV